MYSYKNSTRNLNVRIKCKKQVTGMWSEILWIVAKFMEWNINDTMQINLYLNTLLYLKSWFRKRQTKKRDIYTIFTVCYLLLYFQSIYLVKLYHCSKQQSWNLLSRIIIVKEFCVRVSYTFFVTLITVKMT